MKLITCIIMAIWIAWLWSFLTPVHPKYQSGQQWQSVAERVAARVEQP